MSGMVMPNIGAFMAWGLITAFFIPDGWLPNEAFAQLVEPMIRYLIPLLVAYAGGYIVYARRGAVVGAIAGFGAIAGADMPMFLGAMLMGPVGALAVKRFDSLVEGRIPAGFEMLVHNFAVGILGGVLAMLGLVAVAPACVAATSALASGVGFFVSRGLLPLAAILVEPAKVLFLNNAINHGIFTPLGIEQASQAGKSLFFMIESNPGPGLGLLLAYALVGKGIARHSAPGAIIIQFFGGIHEIYFPYVLMNPVVILGTVAGNAAGILTLVVLDGGLVAAASPGSIFTEMLMTPQGGFGANILAIALAAAVSFLVSSPLLKLFGKDADLDAARRRTRELEVGSKGLEPSPEDSVRHARAGVPGAVRKIVLACDAGMGSSAMGASMLKKKLEAAGLGGIEVARSPISEIPKDAQVIVTRHDLGELAAAGSPQARIVLVGTFLGAPEYDALAAEIAASGMAAAGAASPDAPPDAAVPRAVPADAVSPVTGSSDDSSSAGTLSSDDSSSPGAVTSDDSSSPEDSGSPSGAAVAASPAGASGSVDVRRIVFACDSGMGASAMGATMLKKKLKAAGLDYIEVKRSPVSEIPGDAQVIVTRHELKERAAASCPDARLVLVANFMGAPEYDCLTDELAEARKAHG